MQSSNSVGWSDQIQFKTPPAAGSDELTFLAFGDMGKAPLDESVEHYIQVCFKLCPSAPYSGLLVQFELILNKRRKTNSPKI